LPQSGPFTLQVAFENGKENSIDGESYRNDQQYYSDNLLGFPPNLFGFANFPPGVRRGQSAKLIDHGSRESAN
jgi:hypothetical protein